MKVLGTDKSCKKNETLVHLSKSFRHHVREGTPELADSPEIGFDGNIHTPNGGFVAGNTTFFMDGLILQTTPSKGIEITSAFGRFTGRPELFIDTTRHLVGIGTRFPSRRLEVKGAVKATAFIGDGSALTNLPSGASDHGSLAGLAVDDHLQYLLADGVRSTTNGFAVTGTEGSGVNPHIRPGLAHHVVSRKVRIPRGGGVEQ